MQAKLNNELLNNLGNFINRVLSFIAKPEGWLSSFVIFDLKPVLISCYEYLRMSQDPLTPGVNGFIDTKSHPLILFNLKANNYLLKSAP